MEKKNDPEKDKAARIHAGNKCYGLMQFISKII